MKTVKISDVFYALLKEVLKRSPGEIPTLSEPVDPLKKLGEAVTLIEASFEYVIGEYNDGGKIFHKRK